MRYLLSALPLLISAMVVAQPGEDPNIIKKGTALYYLSEGRAKFENGDKRGALLDFRSALEQEPKNAKAMYWTAEVYLSFGDLEKCVRYAKNCLDEMENQKPQDFVFDCNAVLGEVHLRMNKADEALAYFNAALAGMDKNRVKELGVDRMIENCQNMISWPRNDSLEMDFMPRSILTSYDEYAPVLTNGGNTLYFVSRRDNTTGGGQDPYDKKFYEDIYVSHKDSITGEWSVPDNENVGRLNYKGMDAINWINEDATMVLLTINDAVIEKQKYKTGSSDLFISKLSKKGTWGTPRPVGKPVNSSFFEGAGSFSEDGKTIYFISDRNATKSGSDIYKSRKVGSDWSKPERVANVNSDGHETTVFVTPDEQYMFFSSKGHSGVGGYDVHVSLNLGTKWSVPVNLGMPVNSGEDELFFKYYPEWGKAVYATKREEGQGGYDIMTIDIENLKLPTEEEVIALEEEMKKAAAEAAEADKNKKSKGDKEQ